MQYDGTAPDTVTSGWSNGPQECFSGDSLMEGARTAPASAPELDGDEQSESTLHEIWNMSSLLRDISRPDDPQSPLPVAHRHAMERCLPFSVPHGLELVVNVLNAFQNGQPDPEAISLPANNVKETRRAGRRKWVHKTGLHSLDAKVQSAAEAAKKATKKLKRKGVKEGLAGLPGFEGPPKRHTENVEVVKTQISSLSLTKADGAWIGRRDYGEHSTKGSKSSGHDEQVHRPLGKSNTLNPRWDNGVTQRVKQGWRYIPNDLR